MNLKDIVTSKKVVIPVAILFSLALITALGFYLFEKQVYIEVLPSIFVEQGELDKLMTSQLYDGQMVTYNISLENRNPDRAITILIDMNASVVGNSSEFIYNTNMPLNFSIPAASSVTQDINFSIDPMSSGGNLSASLMFSRLD